MKLTSKAMWTWAAIEVAVAGWVGWQIAKATERPWARTKR